MKTIIVLVAALFVCAFTQQNDEEIIATLMEVQESLCRSEESKGYVAKCYNSFPEKVMQALYGCAGQEYMHAEKAITVACGVKKESIPPYNKESAKEYENCTKTKTEEMKENFDDTMKMSIARECMDLKAYIDKNGIKDAVEKVKSYVKSQKE